MTKTYKVICIVISVILVLCLAGCSGSKSAEDLSDSAVIEDIADGSQTSGEYAYIVTEKENITEETLTDLYFNFYEPNDLDRLMIIYEDDEPYGVFINDSVVEMNCYIEQDSAGQYVYGKRGEDCIVYIPNGAEQTLDTIE